MPPKAETLPQAERLRFFCLRIRAAAPLRIQKPAAAQ